MIGIKPRGIRHLYKLAKDSTDGVRIIVILNTHTITEGIVFPSKMENQVVAAFKYCGPRCMRYEDAYYATDDKYQKAFDTYVNSNRCFYRVCDNMLGFFGGNPYGNSTKENVIAVPESFCSMFEEFNLQNKKLLSTIYGKYIAPDDPVAKALFIISEGNAQFFAWAAKMYARNYVSIYALMHLFEFNENYSNLVKDLSKGNLIALSSNKDVVNALKESFNLRASSIAKQTINWFNPTQKKLLREVLSDTHAVNILNNFSRLSKTKRINFIRKVSTIESAEEILQMMSFLCTNTHFDWNKQSFLEFIHNVDGLQCEVVKDDNNIVVVKVNNYETMKRIGKTTNWCISKNRQYWENYMGDDDNQEDGVLRLRPNVRAIYQDPFIGDSSESEQDIFDVRFEKARRSRSSNSNNVDNKPYQFAIFDFSQPEDSKYSIVGITVNAIRGITNAHNFVNDNMMRYSRGEIEAAPMTNEQVLMTLWHNEDEEATPVGKTDICSFLAKRNIKMSDLISRKYTCCEWSKEGIKNYVAFYCAPDDYQVILETETKLVIQAWTSNMSVVLPCIDTYFNTLEYDNLKGAIWVFDFSKDENNPDKIKYWHVHLNERKSIEYTPVHPYNEGGSITSALGTFSKFLKEHHLPFDIIARPNNSNTKINVYLNQGEYEMAIEEIINAKDKILTSEIQEHILEVLVNEIGNRKTKIFDTIASNNLNLVELLGHDKIIRLCISFVHRIMQRVMDNEWGRKSCFDEVSPNATISEILSLSRKSWDEFLLTARDRQSRDNMARTIILATDARVYRHFIYYILNQAEKNGFTAIYNKFIPKMISTAISNDVWQDDESRQVSMHTFMSPLIRNNIEKWNEISISNIGILFTLLNKESYADIAFTKVKEIFAETDLKPKHISRMITELDNACNGNYNRINNFRKMLDMICAAGKENHIMSEETMDSVIRSRN